MKRLFIGGSRDGDLLDDWDGARMVSVAAKGPPALAYRGDPASTVPKAAGIELYRREILRVACRTFIVYVHSSMEMEDAVESLLMSYPGAKS